jgi:hypothetical protein
MTRKRTAIVLDKLARESACKLESMFAELAGEPRIDANPAQLSHWSRRFAASGKIMPLRPVRMS